MVWGKFLIPDSWSRSKTQVILLSLPFSLAGSGGTGKDQGGQPANPVVAAGDGEALRDARNRGELFVAEPLPLHGSVGPVGSSASREREGFTQVFKQREREEKKRRGREQDGETALKRSR